MSDTQNLLSVARRCMTPCYAKAPFVASHGDGPYLWDIEGKRYLDFTAGIGVNALGHAHPEVAEAIAAQAKRLCHTSNMYHHAGYIEMCEKLVDLTFGDQVFLTNSGVEATEAAMKLARRFFHMRGEPRPGFVAAQGSFHGRSLATLALTGQPSYREGYEPLLPDVTLVPFGNAEALAQAVSDTTAAVFLEPIQGNSGVRIPPTGYLRTVRQICDRTGALLVLDEIQTGFGRTGRWFAHEHEGVVPDIMTLAKAMGGSLPLGAMVSTNEISAAMTPGSHGTTYGGNPVACAAGLATLKIIERDELVQRSEEKGAQLLELVKALEGQTEVRGRGLMVGFDIAGDANAVRARCRELGLLVAGGGKHTIRLLPPLLVESEQLDEACAILQQALNDTAAIDATGA